MASEIAFPTTAPARAPAAPKSSAPIIAGITSIRLSIMPNIISGSIFFRSIFSKNAINIGINPRANITRLTNLPSLIE